MLTARAENPIGFGPLFPVSRQRSLRSGTNKLQPNTSSTARHSSRRHARRTNTSGASLLLTCTSKDSKERKKLDATFGVVVCVVPEEVHTNCRPKSRVANPSDEGISRDEKEKPKTWTREPFRANRTHDQYHMSPDFRRQLKARAMKYGIPIQIVRESTLRLSEKPVFGERGLTPLSDRMWTLSTAL